MIQFHETVMGRTFFQYTSPSIAKALEKQNELLEKQNELLEKKVELMEKEIGVKEDQTRAILDLVETLRWKR